MFWHHLRVFLITILLIALGHWGLANLAFLWLRPLSFLDVPAAELQSGLYSFTLAAPMAFAREFPASPAGLQWWMLAQSLLLGVCVALFFRRDVPLRFKHGAGGRVARGVARVFLCGAGVCLFFCFTLAMKFVAQFRYVTLRADASSPLTLEQRTSTLAKIIPLRGEVFDARFEFHFGGEGGLRGSDSGDAALKVPPSEVEKWLAGGDYKKADPPSSDEMRQARLLAAGWLPPGKAEFYQGKRGRTAEIQRAAGVVLLHFEPVMRD